MACLHSFSKNEAHKKDFLNATGTNETLPAVSEHVEVIAHDLSSDACGD